MDVWKGETISLRAVHADDGDFFFDLTCDSDTRAHLDWLSPPRSLQAARKECEEKATARIENDGLKLVIQTLAGQPVGFTMSHHCDRRVGAFMHGICIHRDHRRKGYGRQASLMLMRYFFDHLRYQKANAHVYSFNEPSRRLHEAMGFVKEGCIRRGGFLNGQHFDLLHFGMTVEEFHELYGLSDPPQA